MAKSYDTAIVLCCLFTLSVARTLPENEDLTTLVPLPISDVNPFIRLPSDPVNAENSDSPATSAVTSVPLTFSTFRQINRGFYVRSKHPCRHHFKVHPTMREHVEIPNGNEMIVSFAENSDFEDPDMIHGGQRQRVRLWHKHHHHYEDSDSDDDDDNDDRIANIVFKRYDYDRFDREKKLKVLKKMRKHFRQQNEEEEKTREEGSFMNRVRKFFDHFF